MFHGQDGAHDRPGKVRDRVEDRARAAVRVGGDQSDAGRPSRRQQPQLIGLPGGWRGQPRSRKRDPCERLQRTCARPQHRRPRDRSGSRSGAASSVASDCAERAVCCAAWSCSSDAFRTASNCFSARCRVRSRRVRRLRHGTWRPEGWIAPAIARTARTRPRRPRAGPGALPAGARLARQVCIATESAGRKVCCPPRGWIGAIRSSGHRIGEGQRAARRRGRGDVARAGLKPGLHDTAGHCERGRAGAGAFSFRPAARCGGGRRCRATRAGGRRAQLRALLPQFRAARHALRARGAHLAVTAPVRCAVSRASARSNPRSA